MGPRIQLHRMSDRNVTVDDRPTASPTNRGWTTDCSTKCSTP
jgi:hypothetical protein